MNTVYIFSSGFLKRKDNSLVLEMDGEKKHIPVENVSEIRVFSEITLNKRLLEFLTKKGIPVHFYNHEGYYVGTYYPRESNSTGATFVKQVEYYIDPEKRVDIAQKMVEGSIFNMIGLLRYYSSRGKDMKDRIDKMEELKNSLYEQDSIPQVMAIEGNAREVYYSAFDEIIEDENFKIEKREKRPPTNYMNTLISFGNSLIYTTVLTEIFKTHLDPRVGYLHEANQRRFTLHLDIADIFKPVIVDRTILRMVNRNQVKTGHFSEIAGGLKLNESGKKLFAKEFETTLKTTVYHSGLKRNVSYRTLIRLEIYKLEKHILGMEEYKAYHHNF